MTLTLRKHTLELISQLSNATQAKEPLDLFRLMNRFTMEAFAELAFGCEMRSKTINGERRFQAAFDTVQIAGFSRVLYPDWLVRVRRYFGIGREGEFVQGLKIVNNTIMDIIKQALVQRTQSLSRESTSFGCERNNLITLYLDNIVSDDETNPDSFDIVGLRDFVVNFFIAGRDTTAQTLSWFFYCISQNPHVEHAIIAELKAKCPTLFASEGSLDIDVHQLIYLEAAIKETLRLYPPVPVNSRSAVRDTVLSDGTLIPAGADVLFSSYALGRMTKVWGSDALEFKPERWINQITGKLIAMSSFKFNAFLAGPRMCLGMNLALLETKIVAAAILSRFRVCVVHGQNVTYQMSATLMMRDPFMVTMQARVR